AFVDGRLGATPQVFTHDPVEFVLGAMALGHVLLFFVMRPGPSPTGETISTAVHASSVVVRADGRARRREGRAYDGAGPIRQGWAAVSGVQTKPSSRRWNRPSPGKGKCGA